MSQEGAQPEKAPKTGPKQPGMFTTLKLWGIIGEIGFLIAVPLVVLLFIGIGVDKLTGTKPLFTLVSLPIALLLSTLAVAKKVRETQQGSETKKAL